MPEGGFVSLDAAEQSALLESLVDQGAVASEIVLSDETRGVINSAMKQLATRFPQACEVLRRVFLENETLKQVAYWMRVSVLELELKIKQWLAELNLIISVELKGLAP